MAGRWMFVLCCLAAATAGAVGIGQRSRDEQQRLLRHHHAVQDAKGHAALAPMLRPAPQATTDALGASYTYDAVGNRATAAYPNGLVTAYAYDPANRLIELHTTRRGATLQRYRFTLDPDGARRRIDATETDGASRTTYYTYDHGRRLTGEEQYRNGRREFAATYRYDAVGNRTQALVNGITTLYAYDANDRLVSETASGGAASGTITYTYDAAGNRVRKSGPMGSVDYLYDDAGRMVETRSAGDVVAYRYAHTGLLVEKTWTPAVGSATTWRYLWDTARAIPQTIEEHTSDGGGTFALSATWLFGDDLIAQTRDGETRYVLADGLGDTRAGRQRRRGHRHVRL